MLLCNMTRTAAMSFVVASTVFAPLSLAAWEGPAGVAPALSIKGSASCFAFSPDGKLLATGLVLRDLSTGKVLSKAEPGSGHGECTCVAFSPDGKRLASVHFDRGLNDARHSILLWNVSANSELQEPVLLPIPEYKGSSLVYRESLHYLTFSPDGRMLATRHFGDETVIWETASGKERLRLATRGLVVAFGRDGRTLISVTCDGLVQHWDIVTGKCVGPSGDMLRKEFLFVLNACASADGSTVALTDGSTVVVKDTRSGKTLRRFEDPNSGHFAFSHELALSSDGKTLAVVSGTGAGLFDVGTGKQLGGLIVPPSSKEELDGWVFWGDGLRFSPTGKLLVTAHNDSVEIWNTEPFIDPAKRVSNSKPPTIQVKNPKAKSAPPSITLEAKVSSRKDAYILNLGGKTATEFARQIDVRGGTGLPPTPTVDLVLTLRNTGNKSLTLLSREVTIRVYLVGDGAMNHPEMPYQTFLSMQEGATLAPGATLSAPIKSLECDLDRRSYWLLPGEYTLIVSGHVALQPSPGAEFKVTDFFGWSLPLRVKVIAQKK
jgi:WD40 repeat protein